MLSRFKPLLPILLGVGCTGSLDDPASSPNTPARDGDSDPAVADGAPNAPGAAKVVMRRLTRREYDNTVRDLLGASSAPASGTFPPEETAFRFDNNAAALTFPPTLADRAFSSAGPLAKLVATNPVRWAACAGAAKDEACAQSVLESFGKRAYRRPLAAEELQSLMSVYRQGASRGFEYGLELASTAALISLPFFYRIERGDGADVPGKPGLVRLTSWEMASRLSYLFLGSLPDPTLVEAAEADALKEPAQIEAQAQRLLATDAAKQSVAHFHRQWLRLDGIASAAKDPQLFPRYTGNAPELLRREADLFLESVAFGGGGFRALMTAPYTFVSTETAPLYGVSAAGAMPGQFVRAELDPAQRSGFLTLAGTLALLGDFAKTSPIRRGAFVRESLLCDVLPPPPPGAATSLPDHDPTLSRRQAVERHSSDPACAGCHALIDPIGAPFETYDAAGQHRTEENGKPIDASGNVINTSIGQVSSAIELAQRLGASPEGQSCFVKQLFRFALGRDESGSEPVIEQLVAQFASGGDSYERVLLQLTQSDAFLYLPKPEVLP
jgi:hypothetical protein